MEYFFSWGRWRDWPIVAEVLEEMANSDPIHFVSYAADVPSTNFAEIAQDTLSHALLSPEVLMHIHHRYRAVKGLYHWIRKTLTIAQKYDFISDQETEIALETLAKLEGTG